MICPYNDDGRAETRVKQREAVLTSLQAILFFNMSFFLHKQMHFSLISHCDYIFIAFRKKHMLFSMLGNTDFL